MHDLSFLAGLVHPICESRISTTWPAAISVLIPAFPSLSLPSNDGDGNGNDNGNVVHLPVDGAMKGFVRLKRVFGMNEWMDGYMLSL